MIGSFCTDTPERLSIGMLMNQCNRFSECFKTCVESRPHPGVVPLGFQLGDLLLLLQQLLPAGVQLLRQRCKLLRNTDKKGSASQSSATGFQDDAMQHEAAEPVR